jgi:hypothetical protein
MAAISLSSFDNYLEGLGITVLGDHIQTFVNLFMTDYSDDTIVTVGTVKQDSTMVLMMGRMSRYIFECAIGAYKSIGLSTDDSAIETWILANRKDISATLAETLGDAIDLINTYFIPSVPTVDNMSAVDVYGGLVSGTLNMITRYLRQQATATTDPSANSSSYGGKSVGLLPDVTV